MRTLNAFLLVFRFQVPRLVVTPAMKDCAYGGKLCLLGIRILIRKDKGDDTCVDVATTCTIKEGDR